MHGIFVAHGPAFKTAVELEPISNTELYNLFCELVQLTPAPNNGTLGALHGLLRRPKTLSEQPPVKVVGPPNLPKTANAIIQRQNQYCLQTCSEVSFT